MKIEDILKKKVDYGELGKLLFLGNLVASKRKDPYQKMRKQWDEWARFHKKTHYKYLRHG